MQPHFAVPNLAVPTFAPASDAGLPLHIVTERTLDAWLAQQDGTTAGWARSMGFGGAKVQFVALLTGSNRLTCPIEQVRPRPLHLAQHLALRPAKAGDEGNHAGLSRLHFQIPRKDAALFVDVFL